MKQVEFRQNTITASIRNSRARTRRNKNTPIKKIPKKEKACTNNCLKLSKFNSISNVGNILTDEVDNAVSCGW